MFTAFLLHLSLHVYLMYMSPVCPLVIYCLLLLFIYSGVIYSHVFLRKAQVFDVVIISYYA